ncbi:MAG: TonB-dependent receptor [Alphaproteobacteria bacterium]|nr:TonB-dependent receptor [Alphaproteobacteria bacterium]
MFKSLTRKQTIRKHTTEILYSTLISMAIIMATNPTVVSAQTSSQKTRQTAKQTAKQTAAQKKAKQKANKKRAADETLTEIVVTGIRGGIMSSIAKKSENSSIVEAVSAEDIGKLPDVSIADSIARLPGLAAQRLDGRAQLISIRGLSPNFTTATLNGREQVTSSNNRGVEFDQYPSELMSGVTVYKTPDASLLAQAIGGTIDMQTVRPLEYGKQAIAIGVRGEYNSLGALNSGTTATGYRASFSYIDQFADDTIGVAIGYARMTSPSQENHWNAWGFPKTGTGFLDANGKAVPSDTLVIGGAKPFVQSDKLTRDGLMGTLEYQPDDTFTTTLDVYYSKFKNDQRLRGVEFPLKWSGAQLQDGMTVQNGLVTKGQFNGVKGVLRNDVFVRNSKIWSIGWNTKYKPSNNWSVETDLSYSKVTRTDVAMESYSGTGRGGGNGATDNLGFTMLANGGAMFSHKLNYADPTLFKIGGPQNWGDPLKTGTWDSQDGFINKPTVNDELYAMRLSVERQLSVGPVSSIKVGVYYRERKKSLKDVGLYLTLKTYPAVQAVPKKYLLPPTSLGFIGIGNILSYDSLAFYNDGNYIETNAKNNDISRSVNSWNVKEKVSVGYIMANIDTNVSDMPLTGNVGVQVVYTDQSSIGTAASNGPNGLVVVPTFGGDKYTKILPSLNLKLGMGDDNYLRLGISRTLARPRMDQMNANKSFNFNQANNKPSSTPTLNSPWSGGGGNPKLRPWMAVQFDLSYEKYFGEGGYVSLAGFYKRLENWIYPSSELFDFSGFPTNGITPVITKGLVSTSKNGAGGKIYGVEFSGSLPGKLIADELDGFGALFSASFTDSSVREKPQDKPLKMPGLSKAVINATLYYESHGFEARISGRYRSDFIGQVSGLSLNRTTVFIKSSTVFDAQVAYDFSEIGYDGLSVRFQVNNLTNEPFSTFQNGDARQVRDFQTYGRTYLLGLFYRM